MPEFSKKSLSKLSTCHSDLQKLFFSVIKDADCSVIEGHRKKIRQNKLCQDGLSKVQYPDSKHNKLPSEAVDVGPYIPGKGISYETRQCYFFAGYVKARASELGIQIRWGGDWDSDNDVNDQKFKDLHHFELRLPEGS